MVEECGLKRILNRTARNICIEGNNRQMVINCDKIRYVIDDKDLRADDFLNLAQKVWPGNYDKTMTQKALEKQLISPHGMIVIF